MKEKYEDLKMEVVAFEEGIWTTQMGTSAMDNASGATRTVTLTETPTQRVVN